jgi:cell division protease FtsH
MVTRFGMTDEFGMVALETVSNRYLGGDTSLACSESTAGKIDQMVVGIVQEQYEKAKEILFGNMNKLHELAKYLYERETITGEEFMDILNAEPEATAGDDAGNAGAEGASAEVSFSE